MMVSVIAPAADETAPESGKMMGVVGPRFSIAAAIAGIFSLASGLIMYYFTSGLAGGGGSAFSAWLGTFTGLSLSIGALFGLTVFIYGASVVGPTTTKLVELGQKIAASGGPPSPEDGAQLARLQQANASNVRIVAIMFVIVVVGMSAAGV